MAEHPAPGNRADYYEFIRYVHDPTTQPAGWECVSRNQECALTHSGSLDTAILQVRRVVRADPLSMPVGPVVLIGVELG